MSIEVEVAGVNDELVPVPVEEADPEVGEAGAVIPVPILPLLLPVSGSYVLDPLPITLPVPALPKPIVPVEPIGPFPPFRRREELRLDVDGRYPQMVASGTVFAGWFGVLHWIADLTQTGRSSWSGPITYTDGPGFLLPYTDVAITAARTLQPLLRRATVTFSAASRPDRVRSFRWANWAFHPVELEYDTVAGSAAVTSFDTGSHPNRPAALPVETLSIETVYRRAGFDVTVGANSAVPFNGTGPDALWSDMEMHDAMQVHWSRFANQAQWATWALFAGQHEPVPALGITPMNLGGIMFDDIGPNHRQGAAVFNDSFIGTPPAGDPDGAAAVNRIKFWTAVHELGHSFNLAHSWQKALTVPGVPWIPLVNLPEARTFMNYPYRVAGGAPAFFDDFEYRFTDDELLFLRHAPSRFVQPGNAAWFDHHGFEGAAISPSPDLHLEVRVHRRESGPRFQFLEPVVVECKLTNVSAHPCVIDANVFHSEEMAVIVKRRGSAARRWTPYVQYCLDKQPRVLEPGASLYAPLSISAGVNGWDLAEPGSYDIVVAMHLPSEDLVSNVLTVRVDPPVNRDEETLAEDVFTDEVGRVLAFKGTRELTDAVDALQAVIDRLPEQRIATHAQLALGNALAQPYKRLVLNEDGTPEQIVLDRPQPATADALLSAALRSAPEQAADTLGHIDYTQQVVDHAALLAGEGHQAKAVVVLSDAEELLADRGVLPRVLDELAAERTQHAPAPRKRAKKSANPSR